MCQGVDPGARRVALCFDDAWSSVITVAVPLLKKYGLTAITYVAAVVYSMTIRLADGRHLLAVAVADTNLSDTYDAIKAATEAGVVK